MHDPKLAIAAKLTSQGGAESVGQASAVHADSIGMDTTNDRLAESVFGAFKFCRRRNPGIGQRRASGLAQEMVMKRFSRGPAARLTKRKQVAPVVGVKKRRQTQAALGFFHSLPYKEQVALLEMARAEREAERKLDRSDMAELDAHRGMTRQSNSELELQSLIKRFAHALSFFDTATSSVASRLSGSCRSSSPVSRLSRQVEARSSSSTGFESRLRCAQSASAG